MTAPAPVPSLSFPALKNEHEKESLALDDVISKARTRTTEFASRRESKAFWVCGKRRKA